MTLKYVSVIPYNKYVILFYNKFNILLHIYFKIWYQGSIKKIQLIELVLQKRED